jgi:thiamine-phosphate pyrophosphorylase
LWLVTDEARRPDPLPAILRLRPGAGIVLRHYRAAGRVALAKRIAAAARRRRLALVVAADWRLAASVGAAGLHLPEAMLRSGRLAPALGWARRRRRLVTAACHSPAALAAARRLGIDAALLSPVFATASHPGADALGPLRFRQWCRRAGLPVYALGGITAATARRLAGSGAAGLAGVGVFG